LITSGRIPGTEPGVDPDDMIGIPPKIVVVVVLEAVAELAPLEDAEPAPLDVAVPAVVLAVVLEGWVLAAVEAGVSWTDEASPGVVMSSVMMVESRLSKASSSSGSLDSSRAKVVWSWASPRSSARYLDMTASSASGLVFGSNRRRSSLSLAEWGWLVVSSVGSTTGSFMAITTSSGGGMLASGVFGGLSSSERSNGMLATWTAGSLAAWMGDKHLTIFLVMVSLLTLMASPSGKLDELPDRGIDEEEVDACSDELELAVRVFSVGLLERGFTNFFW